MTEINALFAQLEVDLRAEGKPSPASCRRCETLPDHIRDALAPALLFLGCRSPRFNVPVDLTAATLPLTTRVGMARLMLLTMAPETGDPRWSSRMLETAFAIAAESLSGGSASDLTDALLPLLDEPPLTEVLASFLLAFVRRWFVGYRSDYDEYDFTSLEASLGSIPPPATAYFATLSLPPKRLQIYRRSILRALPPGPYRDEAARLFEQDS
jgi:hypothetical protein